METTEPAASGFGALLKRYRLAAGYSQEELAERARLSVRAISAYERGQRQVPYRDTVQLLAAALGLSLLETAALEATIPRRRGPQGVTSQAAAEERRAQAALTGRQLPESGGGTEPPLVGRARELALLERHLAGEGPAVLVLAGEPGIGKSRLLAEAARRAAAQGWTVLTGGCQRRGGQDPYAPLLGALQRSLRAQSPTTLRRVLQGCAWLVRLIPELVDSPIEPLPPWTASPAQERRLMLEAARRYLEHSAGPAGTLLVLDDLQWAGQDALDLLGALLQSDGTASLRLIAAYRDTDVPTEAPLALLLADLAATGLLVRRALDPLSPAEAAQLLDGLLGETRGTSARDERLLRRTGGMPFFLVSCAQALREGEEQVDETAPWDVAQSLRQRIAALPPAAQEVLRVAAVVGRVSPRAVLAAVVALPGNQVLDALDAACQARLIEEDGHSGYRFAHDIVREVVYGELSAARRAALHQRVATVLERLDGTHAVEVLAYHYTHSDALECAVPYLEQAGDRAVAQFANRAAEGHYRELIRCLEVLGRQYERARAYSKLGLLQIRTGRYADAGAALEQVAATYSIEAKTRSPAASAGADSVHTILSLIDEHEPERTRGIVLLAYAQHQAVAHRPQDRLRVLDRAVQLARHLRDGILLAQALEGQSIGLFMIGRRDAAFAAAWEALQLSEAHGDLVTLSAVLIDLVFVHVHRGEFEQGNRYNARLLSIAEAVGDTFGAAWVFERRAWMAKYTGHWEQAARDLAHALQLAPELAEDHWFDCMRGELCLVQGAWEDATAHFERASERAARAPYIPAQVCAQTFLAELDVRQGRPAAALTRIQAALGQDAAEYRPALLNLAAQSYLQLGDVEQAATASRHAVSGTVENEDTFVLPEPLRVQALVAVAQGRWQEARQTLEEGLALARQIGLPYAEARLLQAHGLLHDRLSEMDAARERLTAALDIFHHLGARKDLEETARLLATVIEQAGRPPTGKQRTVAVQRALQRGALRTGGFGNDVPALGHPGRPCGG